MAHDGSAHPHTPAFSPSRARNVSLLLATDSGRRHYQTISPCRTPRPLLTAKMIPVFPTVDEKPSPSHHRSKIRARTSRSRWITKHAVVFFRAAAAHCHELPFQPLVSLALSRMYIVRSSRCCQNFATLPRPPTPPPSPHHPGTLGQPPCQPP